MNEQSIVHWFAERDAHQCGYCKSASGSVQIGMWAQSLTVDDYQNLIDRGWRRSGQYCYKPVMEDTCCPLYSIRCDTRAFRATKSQKKVMKNMNKFLRNGELKRTDSGESQNEDFGENIGDMHNYKECPKNVNVGLAPENIEKLDESEARYNVKEPISLALDEKLSKHEKSGSLNSLNSSKDKTVSKGLGADPNKPPCKKAKVMRLERKSNKSKVEIRKNNGEKSLEEFLNNVSPDDKHKLKTVLIEPTHPKSEWKKFEQLEFELFKKYQDKIHNDPPDKNNLTGFLRFLVNTPLQKRSVKDSDVSYGSYHQQYWLDEKLIAVSVIDILPKCISAVYFFYDPDYRELTLGTYSALKEVQLSRELTPLLNTEYYYMGYYIHTCPKMRYKGNMHPSFLLCPESYQWIPIEKSVTKLDVSKYSRLNDDLDALDEDDCAVRDLDEMKIVIENQFMRYGKFKRYLGKNEENYLSMGKLVGKKCLNSLFFFDS